MSALAPFATKNGVLPKRREGPTELTSSNDHLVSANQERPARAIACAHGKKVLAYKAEQRLGREGKR